MTEKTLRFNLDKENVNLSYYRQIKGQLLSAIYCGKIQEGDRLPSIRELADDLDVNYKTIRKIYVRLAEENYIEIVKGSGAFLQKKSGRESYQQMRSKAIFKLLGEVSERAKSLGLKPSKFSRLYNSFVNGTDLRKLKLAVVDHSEEAFIFSRELQMRLNAEAFPVNLEGQPSEEEERFLKEADCLLTTSWHLDEVTRLADSLKKPLLEIKPSHAIYTEILSEAQDRNTAIVIQDEKTLHAPWEVFMNIFHPSTDKKFWIAPIDREDLIERIVEEADVIFVSPMCWDEMRKRTPAERELKTYENVISDETIDGLKQMQLLG
ncbi:MAG TPA: GntR family transcriptional regulator [Acidobacteriota bacterium]|nr:GntR family transcriptional regulator [Acidobacteriota bacterium]